MSKAFKPTLFTLNRNKTIGGTLGHAIEFKKDVPTHVPREMWAEVQAAGALPVNDLPVEEKKKTSEPEDPAERESLIFTAFEQMVLTNNREDFTGTGAPHGKALEKMLGFSINNKERDVLWQKFQTKED